MPSVPSTALPVHPLASVPLHNPAFLPSHQSTSTPTPDPDTDDVILVYAEVGHAVSQVSTTSTSPYPPSIQPYYFQASPEQNPPQPTVKPRIDLATLDLHSPSSIVGTPFDLSPRFEYPFSLSTSVASDIDTLIPSLSTYPSSLASLDFHMHTSMSLPPSLPSSVPPRTKREIRSFSPTQSKRDPPIPPGLVKKRLLNANMISVSDHGAPAASPSAQQARGRGASLSTLPHKLKATAQNGDNAESAASRPGDKPRSQSLDPSLSLVRLTLPSSTTVTPRPRAPSHTAALLRR
ncbi:hypothetical protein C8Q74DRAFT_630686 [Fomes fomentarius]|nr:hypothetical protein C8Q74DRAFT_630686 [Fomes fomentarius]